MSKRRVLVITYYFPPRSGIGSLRLRGLAKYLPEFRWEPIILTPALPSSPDERFRVVQTPYPGDVSARFKKILHLNQNKGFQEQVGIPLSIREGKRSFTVSAITFVKSMIAYPDDQKSWYSFAVKTGTELLQKGDINALLSSSSPVITHLIGAELKKRFHIPWVADLRDLWTQNPYYPYGLVRKWFEKRLELSTFAHADALITTSEPWAEELKSLHSNKKVMAILNGFDPDEMRSASVTKKFTITHTGQLYQGKRDPTLLLSVLHELITEGLINPDIIHVQFFGPAEHWLEQAIRKYGLEGIAKQHGVIDREIALTKQRESQILLLLNWDNPREQGTYTGKVFEYLAASRPILAVGGPKGVVSELLEQTKVGVHVKNATELKRLLHEWYMEYLVKGQVSYKGEKEKIIKYSHIEMAKRFAEILNEVVHE